MNQARLIFSWQRPYEKEIIVLNIRRHILFSDGFMCRGVQLTDRVFLHQREYRIRLEPGADEREPGGAVTVSLCGHWDHEGPCRWPHFSTITPDVDGYHRLVVEFDAHADELETVIGKLDAGVMHGQLIDSDGAVSTWFVEQ